MAANPFLNQAQQLFDIYATDFEPGQQGLEFWANKFAAPGADAELVRREFLNPAQGSAAPRYTAMTSDPDYLAAIGKGPTSPTAQAQDLFNTYATGFDPGKQGIDFWSQQIQQQGYENALADFLNPEQGAAAPRYSAMQADPDYANAVKQARDTEYFRQATGQVGEENRLELDQSLRDWYNTYTGGQGMANTIEDYVSMLSGRDTTNLQQDYKAAKQRMLRDAQLAGLYGGDVTGTIAYDSWARQQDPKERARQLFSTYATGMTPDQEAIDFWASRFADPRSTEQSVLNEFLNPRNKQAERITTMEADPAYQMAKGILSLPGAETTVANKAVRDAIAKSVTPTGEAKPDAKEIVDTERVTDANLARAKALFDTFATGFTPDRTALEFWASQFGKPGATTESVVKDFLNPKEGATAPRKETMLKDIDYLAAQAATGAQGAADKYKDALRELAVSDPNAAIFKKNPDLLNIYKPIEEIKSGTVGQYGYAYGIPILSASVADELLGENKVIGAERELQHGQGVAKELGADPNSKYAGKLATGAGIFGITGKSSDFKRYGDIDTRILAAGGVQSQVDPETGEITQGIYEDVETPDGIERRFTKLTDLFETAQEKSEGPAGSTAADEYQKYQANKKSLLSGAKSLGLNPDDYPDLQSLYEAINNNPKVKDVYLWQGRTAGWDPSTASALGVQTTDINQRGVVNHAQILYRKEGDKLVPILDPTTKKPIVTAFKFDDPNTSRGFIGDLLGNIGAILSIPPIAMAFAAAGGLQGLLTGNLGVGAGYGAGSQQFADAMAKSWLSPASIGSSLNIGNILGKTGEQLLGQSAINTGLGALTAGLSGANLEQALKMGAASGVGTGVGGLTSLALGDMANKDLAKFLSNVAGGAAGSAVMGGDVEEYIKNQLLSQGIGQLLNVAGKATDSALGSGAAKTITSLLPLVQNKKLTPSQAVQLAMALSQTGGGKRPPPGR